MKIKNNNRRRFLKTVMAEMLLTVPVINAFSKMNIEPSVKANTLLPQLNKVKIGIIGAENSHSYHFAQFFNVKKSYPGIEVSHIWGETDEFAKCSAEKGAIPNIVKDPLEMIDKIDAVIVDHRDGKYHMDAVRPFIEKKIPAFVDKPFCYDPVKGKELLLFARKMNVPITSLSTLAYTPLIDSIKEKLDKAKKVGQVVMYGPGRVHSKYSGVYYYTVHCVQTITRLFGESINRVRFTGSKDNVIANLEYEDGLIVTLPFIEHFYGFHITIETNEGFIDQKISWEEVNRPIALTAVVEMFTSGKEPRDHQKILNEVCVLQAMERSLKSQQWENVEYVLLNS